MPADLAVFHFVFVSLMILALGAEEVKEHHGVGLLVRKELN